MKLHVPITLGTSPARGAGGYVAQCAYKPMGCEVVRSGLQSADKSRQAINDFQLRPPDALKPFDEVYLPDELCHLFVGNGINPQLGYDTSSKGILKKMAEIYPEIYGDYYESIPDDFEFEKIFLAGLPVSRDLIILHFMEALVSIVGNANRRRETAVRFIAKFDSVVSLNFDLVIPMSYSMIGKYSLELLVADAFNALREKYESEGIMNHGIHHPEFEILEEPDKVGQGNLPKGELRAMSEGGLVTYDFWYGKLRPVEGFRQRGPRLVWDPSIRRTCHFPHGTLIVYVDRDGIVCRQPYSTADDPKGILDYYEKDVQPLLILDSDSEKKMSAIERHTYLDECVQALGKIEGCLYVYGVGIKKSTDIHLWKEIDNNDKLHTIFVARGVGEVEAMKDIRELLKKKKNIEFFDREL